MILAAAWLAACGGRVEEPGEGGGPAASGGAAGTGTAGTGNAPGSTMKLPTHPLGQCVPGFDRSSNPNRSCPWVSQAGQCFDSVDAACACICPTTGNSVCSSNFASGPGATTTVYCD
ncbi:MAG TPA: hypothetical protein VNW92_32060 [Polyangiaceae bacterium]|nr:hypothetical protein [Polyangiaceae bacterium]